jgi:hypothetical protein
VCDSYLRGVLSKKVEILILICVQFLNHPVYDILVGEAVNVCIFVVAAFRFERAKNGDIKLRFLVKSQ